MSPLSPPDSPGAVSTRARGTGRAASAAADARFGPAATDLAAALRAVGAEPGEAPIDALLGPERPEPGAAPDAVLAVDADGWIRYANPAAAARLGDTPQRLVGRDVVAALHDAGLGAAALAMSDALAPRRTRSRLARGIHAFACYDADGVPHDHWRVAHVGLPTPRGTSSAVVVVRPQPRDVAAAAPRDRHEGETLAAVARSLAGAASDVTAVLDEISAGALRVLDAAGACIVLVDPAPGRVVAASGLLAPLRGTPTAPMPAPSLLDEASAEAPPAWTNDAEHDPRVDPLYVHRFGARHVLVAPLQVEGQVLGGIVAVNSGRGAFDALDAELAQRLADHGALALRNARLYDAAQRSARHAGLLADAARVLANHVTAESLFVALGGVVTEALGASGFRVTLADPASRVVEQRFDGGVGHLVPEYAGDAFWQTAGGRSMLAGRPIFFPDLAAVRPGEANPEVMAASIAAGARSAALLPLIIGGESRGLLALLFPELHAFDGDERRLLVDLGAQVAVAVRNVSLLDARERARARAEAAAEIARVALAGGSVGEGSAAILAVLDRLVPTAGKVVNVVTTAANGTTHVVCVAGTGEAARMRGAHRPTAHAIAPQVYEAGQVLTVEDVRRAMPPGLAERMGEGWGVLLPLVARGRPIGALGVLIAHGRRLSADDRAYLTELTGSVALALDALLLIERDRHQRAEERRLAEQLRQAEKMAALGELVAGVAHEINNPLTGISAFAELLLEDPLSDEQRDGVRLIKREADRAVGVVRDLLDFSRKTEPTYLAVDLAELLERLVRTRSYALRSAGVEVVLDLEPDLPSVRGDDAKLQQVFLNLLLNAEYAMRDVRERRLTVSARRESRATGDRVLVTVRDSGPGMTEEIRARVFEPFFTTKPPGDGTGLGLTVSYGIVQAHGGDIAVQSVPGAGASFGVSLPVEPPTIDGAPSPTDVQP